MLEDLYTTIFKDMLRLTPDWKTFNELLKKLDDFVICLLTSCERVNDIIVF